MKLMLHIIVLILHVLGASILVSTAIFSLLLTTKGEVTKERLKTIDAFEKLAPIAALSQLATGIFLFSEDANKFGKDPVLWSKVILYVISGFLAGKVIKHKKQLLLKKPGKIVKLGKLPLLFLLELCITLTIISLGVMLVEGL